MKNINYLFLFALLSISVYFISNNLKFNPKTGDEKFDERLSELNTSALTDLQEFKVAIANEYHIEEQEIEHLFSTMEPAEILLSYEVARLINKPISVVFNSYTNNSKKGWNVVFEKLGIEKNSAHFEDLAKIKLVNPDTINNSLSKN